MEVKFEDMGSSFETNFAQGKTFSAEVEEVTEVATNDHRQLLYRDAENAHPMSSITGLTEELGSKPGEALTNLEIESLLK